jgi:hypothetical protein
MLLDINFILKSFNDSLHIHVKIFLHVSKKCKIHLFSVLYSQNVVLFLLVSCMHIHSFINFLKKYFLYAEKFRFLSNNQSKTTFAYDEHVHHTKVFLVFFIIFICFNNGTSNNGNNIYMYEKR